MKKWLLGTLAAAVVLSGVAVYVLYDLLDAPLFASTKPESAKNTTYSVLDGEWEHAKNGFYRMEVVTAEDGSQSFVLQNKQPGAEEYTTLAESVTNCIVTDKDVYYQQGDNLCKGDLLAKNGAVVAPLAPGAELVCIGDGYAYAAVGHKLLMRTALDGSGTQNNIVDLNGTSDTIKTVTNPGGAPIHIAGDWVQVGNARTLGFQILADGSGQRKPL